MKNILYLILLGFKLLNSQVFTPTDNNTQTKQEVIKLLKLYTNANENAEISAAYNYAQKALIKSKKINYEYGMAYSNLYIGQTLIDRGQLNTALKFLKIAEQSQYSKNNPIIMAEIYTVKARIYDMVTGLENAVIEQRKALDILNEGNNTQAAKILKIKAYINFSFFYTNQNRNDSADFYLAKTKKAIKEVNEKLIPSKLLMQYHNMKAITFIPQKQYDSISFYLTKSENIAAKRNYKNVSPTYFLWGNIYALKKDYKTAISYYLKSLHTMEELNYVTLLKLRVYDCLAQMYSNIDNMDKANEYKAKFIDYQRKTSNEYNDAHYNVMDSIAKEKEDQERSHFRKYIVLFSLLVLLAFLFILYFFNQKIKAGNKKIIMQEEIILQNEEKIINKEAFSEVVQLAKENNPEFLTRFREVYPDIVPALVKINPKLQISEISFCAYLYLSFSSKDIAEYTFVTPRAVQLRKNRLRKKLQISSEEDIYLWIQNVAHSVN